jgi:hypothetical protein
MKKTFSNVEQAWEKWAGGMPDPNDQESAFKAGYGACLDDLRKMADELRKLAMYLAEQRDKLGEA